MSTRRLTTTALFAAIIYIVTAHLHIPSGNGYIHVGDGFIYLAACLLPTGYAAAAAALGAGLADGLSGYPMWILPTVIIKALTVLAFNAGAGKIISRRNLLAIIPALILCGGGYYVAEAIIYGNWIAPIASIPSYFVQVGASALVFVTVGSALDRNRFKERHLF